MPEISPRKSTDFWYRLLYLLTFEITIHLRLQAVAPVS